MTIFQSWSRVGREFLKSILKFTNYHICTWGAAAPFFMINCLVCVNSRLSDLPEGHLGVNAVPLHQLEPLAWLLLFQLPDAGNNKKRQVVRIGYGVPRTPFPLPPLSRLEVFLETVFRYYYNCLLFPSGVFGGDFLLNIKK